MKKNAKKKLIAFVRDQGVIEGKTFPEIMQAYKNKFPQWSAYGAGLRNQSKQDFSFSEIGSHFFIWCRVATNNDHA